MTDCSTSSNESDNTLPTIPMGGLIDKEQLQNCGKLLAKIPLIPLKVGFGIVKTAPEKQLSLRDAVLVEAKKQGHCTATLVFAVRRPGCGGCREHALQLSKLASSQSGLAVLGIVKETGVDDASLSDFHTHYFRKLPLYKDEHWRLFKAMGGRKMGFVSLVVGYFASRRRHADNKIETVLGAGDGWMQGGVLIFNRHGELRYAFDDTYGYELDVEAIKSAIEAAQEDESQEFVPEKPCLLRKVLPRAECDCY